MYHLSADGHLGSHFLTIMNNADMNIHEQFCCYVFSFLGCMPRSEISGSYAIFMLNFVGKMTKYTILHFHKQFQFFHIVSTIVTVNLFNYTHCSGYEVAPFCGFDLYFLCD